MTSNVNVSLKNVPDSSGYECASKTEDVGTRSLGTETVKIFSVLLLVKAWNIIRR